MAVNAQSLETNIIRCSRSPTIITNQVYTIGKY